MLAGFRFGLRLAQKEMQRTSAVMLRNKISDLFCKLSSLPSFIP